MRLHDLHGLFHRGDPPDPPAPATDALPLALYTALFVEFVANIFWPRAGSVADATGQVWNHADIYQSPGLVSIFTTGFVILLGMVQLQDQRA